MSHFCTHQFSNSNRVLMLSPAVHILNISFLIPEQFRYGRKCFLQLTADKNYLQPLFPDQTTALKVFNFQQQNAETQLRNTVSQDYYQPQLHFSYRYVKIL